jgi:hypothetical protein
MAGHLLALHWEDQSEAHRNNHTCEKYFHTRVADMRARLYIAADLLRDIPFQAALIDEILRRLDRGELGFSDSTTGLPVDTSPTLR